MPVHQPNVPGPTVPRVSRKRAGVAVSVAALAVTLGVGAWSGVSSPASANVGVSSLGHHRTPTPSTTSTPTATSSPVPTSSATSAPSIPLNPGPAPTTVGASVARKLLGTVRSTYDGTVTVTVTTAGRYTLEYDASQPSGFNNVVDGVVLQQVGAGSNQVVYSQTFSLGVGQHTVRLGGPQVGGPATEYLDGPLN